jgi:hypothetical protein
MDPDSELSDSNAKNSQKVESNSSSPYQMSVNTKKNQILQRQIAADEEQYIKMKSVRPQGGSGVVGGGKMLSSPVHQSQVVEYVLSNEKIMETMQLLDIGWEEAKQLLILQLNETQGGNMSHERHHVTEGNVTPDSEQVRLQRVSNAKKCEIKKQKDREAYEYRQKQLEQNAIDEKKERARLRGIALQEKEIQNRAKMREDVAAARQSFLRKFNS